MKVLIDRDSVHPGDDVNHEGTVRAPRSTAVGQFLSDYAPRLSFTNGTDACWVIEQGSLVGDRTAIGVWPQHWKPGNLLDVSVRTLGDLIGEGEPALYFRYHPGLDPAIVLDLLKQGKLSPGMHIPVVPAEKVLEAQPDYLLILPWNLTREITRQMRYVGDWGCRFVVPIPEVRVIDPAEIPA